MNFLLLLGFTDSYARVSPTKPASLSDRKGAVGTLCCIAVFVQLIALVMQDHEVSSSSHLLVPPRETITSDDREIALAASPATFDLDPA